MNTITKAVKPFKALKVTAVVDWDEDEDKVIDEEIVAEFTPETLRGAADCLTDSPDGDWLINNRKLEEFLSDWLSDATGFCHKGFSWVYSCRREETGNERRIEGRVVINLIDPDIDNLRDRLSHALAEVREVVRTDCGDIVSLPEGEKARTAYHDKEAIGGGLEEETTVLVREVEKSYTYQR